MLINMYISNTVNRPRKRLTSISGLVIHWIGCACADAVTIRNNFERASKNAQGGTQYVIGYDGKIICTMPENEVAWHCGGDGYYTPLKYKICGNNNPNYYFTGIECCIGDKKIPKDYTKHKELGKPSDIQYIELVKFAGDFLKRNGLCETDLYRHGDITGKSCHTYYMQNLDKWEKFKSDVKKYMNGECKNMDEIIKRLEVAEAKINKLETPMVYDYVDNNMPEWARGTISKLMHKNILMGDENGRLGLTDEMIRIYVVMDRAGVFG